MMTNFEKYSELFDLLSRSISDFVAEVNRHGMQEMATEEWTVKDELCHIVFWHEYYAQNYAAMADGTKPFLFVSKGGSTRNQDGVDKLRNWTKEQLLKSLDLSQASLYKSIVIKRVPKMTYIVGSEYSTDDFLEMITGHINRHALLVRRAK